MAVVNLGEIVMILDYYRQGLSISAIARRTGLDRKTVRKCGFRHVPATHSDLIPATDSDRVPATHSDPVPATYSDRDPATLLVEVPVSDQG